MPKRTVVFSCNDCGAQSNKWLGRCPECNAWNSYAEEQAEVARPANSPQLSTHSKPLPIDSIGTDQTPRLSTEYPNFDRVLGGGLVPGSVTLVGGEPGIGKSTLLLQAAQQLAKLGPVLYVSGEESPAQIGLRAHRLGTLSPNILLYSETSVELILQQLESIGPVAAVIDSIQTVYTTSSNSSAGSVGQVRDSAGILMAAAKRLGIPVFLIGHITKDGSIAGPKTLEHIVDTVIYFEGDRFQNGRALRATKNRFGPANEIALYRMHDTGLEEIDNPSAALIAQRSDSPGSAIVVAVEGTRPLLIELQALVSPTHYPSPKRTATGFDSARLSLLLAVLEKKTSFSFNASDVYVNIAGGLAFDEPAIDLGAIAALVSSQRNVSLPPDLAIFGEVGLLGEVRSVSQANIRAREAAALGFKRLIVPYGNMQEIQSPLQVTGIRTVQDVVDTLFPL